MKRYQPRLKHIDCTGSSNLTGLHYDTQERVLTASFKDGSTYKYEGVPAIEWLELENADSKGSQFHRFSKNYKGVKQ